MCSGLIDAYDVTYTLYNMTMINFNYFALRRFNAHTYNIIVYALTRINTVHFGPIYRRDDDDDNNDKG